MPTVTSRVPALLTYLVNLFTNDATLGQASPPVTVFDGPQTTGLDPFLKLFVGLSDPDNDAAEVAADSQEAWAAIGRRGRNEMFAVHCCAEAWSGADDMATVRGQVAGIVAAVAALMQADATSFGGNVLFPDPGLTNAVWLQNNTKDGPVARVQFDLVFKSRIGG